MKKIHASETSPLKRTAQLAACGAAVLAMASYGGGSAEANEDAYRAPYVISDGESVEIPYEVNPRNDGTPANERVLSISKEAEVVTVSLQSSRPDVLPIWISPEGDQLITDDKSLVPDLIAQGFYQIETTLDLEARRAQQIDIALPGEDSESIYLYSTIDGTTISVKVENQIEQPAVQ